MSDRSANKTVQTKICLVCGRPFTNRKKWRARGQWEQVVYCSQRCRGAAKSGPAQRPGDG